MKKSLLLLLTIVCLLLCYFNQKALALSGGPDTYGYTWKDSNEPGGPVYNWIDISNLPGSAKVIGLNDDNAVGPFSIGFDFPFYWYTASTFWVGSNGYIGFNNQLSASPFGPIPLAANPNNFIAPMTCDLNFDNTSGLNPAKCYYWRNVALDTLIVSWENVPIWVSTAPNQIGANTFQIILSLVDSSITFQYKQQTGTSAATTNFMKIGIENISGNIGLQHSHDVYPPINYAVKYYFPSNSTFQVSDASSVWNNNVESAGVFLQKGTTPYNLSAQVKNAGNQPLASFSVVSRVLNSSNVASAVNNVSTSGTLAPGATETFNHPVPFLPSATGTFRYITTTNLSGDATSSNNTVNQEIVVVDTTITGSVELAYCDNTNEGDGISWQGGAAGVGVYFKPPFHPFKIEKLSYYIVANPNNVGFYAQLFAPDGPGGIGGTVLLDSLIGSPFVNILAWNDVILANPIVIYDTAIFMTWFMDGEGIAMGQDTDGPFSHRNYEILGSAWSTYRSSETEDLMLKMTVSPVEDTASSGLGFNELEWNKWKLAPNPFNENIIITADGKNNEPINTVNISDISGRLVFSQKVNGKRIVLSLGDLSPGIYLVTLKGDTFEKNIKMVRN